MEKVKIKKARSKASLRANGGTNTGRAPSCESRAPYPPFTSLFVAHYWGTNDGSTKKTRRMNPTPKPEHAVRPPGCNSQSGSFANPIRRYGRKIPPKPPNQFNRFCCPSSAYQSTVVPLVFTVTARGSVNWSNDSTPVSRPTPLFLKPPHGEAGSQTVVVVDPDHPEVQLAGDAVCARDVVRPHRSGEARTGCRWRCAVRRLRP